MLAGFFVFAIISCGGCSFWVCSFGKASAEIFLNFIANSSLGGGIMRVIYNSLFTLIFIFSQPFLSGIALASLSISGYSVDRESIGSSGSNPIVSLRGKGFGVKENPAPLLWVFGADVRQNGVAVSVSDYKIGAPLGASGRNIWGRVDESVTVSDVVRYPELGYSYFVGNVGTLGSPLVFGGENPPYADYIYFSFRVKPLEKWHRFRNSDFFNLSGRFDMGPSRYEAGERVLVRSPDGSSTTGGRIIYLDPETRRVTFDTEEGWGSSQLHNASVTGVNSGAFMVLKTDEHYAFSTGSKYFRMWSGDKPGLYNTFSTNRLIVGYRDGSGNLVSTPKTDTGEKDLGYGVPDVTDRLDWRLVETFIDQSGTNLLTYVDVDNQSRRYLRNIDISGIDKLKDRSPTISQVGLDAAGGTESIDAGLYFGEIYFDNSAMRVMLSNEKTYSDSGSNLEIQFPLTWKDDFLQFEFRPGKLNPADTLYVYIFNKDSVPNEDGIPICVDCRLSAPASVELSIE
jgi:hypothetical protein